MPKSTAKAIQTETMQVNFQNEEECIPKVKKKAHKSKLDTITGNTFLSLIVSYFEQKVKIKFGRGFKIRAK